MEGPNVHSEQRHGGYYIAGARISLDSIVCAFNAGNSPERIQESFPALELSRIYGAIAFYPPSRYRRIP